MTQSNIKQILGMLDTLKEQLMSLPGGVEEKSERFWKPGRFEAGSEPTAGGMIFNLTHKK
jgi:hypothetical protein